jgi:rhamnogalacturonyl hydrolase YesR
MDTQARLHVHGWAQRDNRGRLPPWADPITGRNPVFWGRGNGWVMAGLAEVLLRLPPSDPSYPFILESFQQSAAGLLAVREPSGMWKSVLQDPSRDHGPAGVPPL